MQVELSDREIKVLLSALAEKKEFYESVRENPDGITAESAKKALEVVASVEKKLNSETPVLEAEDPPEPELENSSEPGKFLYLYVPDGIRDQEFEEELASRIPETSGPEPDNFFWSSKYSNFVVKKEFTEEAKQAIREHYNGDVILKRNPEWAKKPTTWQIIGKEEIRAFEEASEETPEEA